jgi:NADH-quinone oxidoreductase subunit N
VGARGGSRTRDTRLGAFYSADFLALFFKRFALLTTLVVVVQSIEFLPSMGRVLEPARPQAGFGEFIALPVILCAGLMWMASAADFIMVFVALELVTICFYILVSFLRRSSASLEAGTKYLILGALSTGFLVYGITWVYGITGQTALAAIGQASANPDLSQPHLLFGVLLVGIGLGFKVAAAPFQFWVPDVYQGAPTPVTALLSVGSKALGFLVLIRVIDAFRPNPELHAKLLAGAAVLAGATLIYGNLAALPQNNLKRLLAYSSIAHAGYLLVGVACAAGPAIGFYLAAYLFMTLLAFLVLIVVAVATGGDDIASFNGLAQRSPFLAFAMMIAMVALAGLPFTAGFIGKFLIFAAAIEGGHWVLVALGALGVACGFYYYLKVIRAMYWKTPESGLSAITVSSPTRITIALLITAIIVFGVWPTPILALLR